MMTCSPTGKLRRPRRRSSSRQPEAQAPCLHEIGRLKLPPGAVADMEHLNLHLFLEDAVYHAINMRLSTV